MTLAPQTDDGIEVTINYTAVIPKGSLTAATLESAIMAALAVSPARVIDVLAGYGVFTTGGSTYAHADITVEEVTIDLTFTPVTP